MNIVITGGSKGIGKALATKFASEKYNVFICARNKQRLDEVAGEINKSFPNSVKTFVADFSDNAQVLHFAQWLLDKKMNIDILINNAGTFIPGSVHDEEKGTMETMMQVNFFSAYHLTRALLPAMMQKRSGHIFNMCSIAALQAYSNGGAYSISKHALMGFSRNLREEMKPYHIKVTAVYPGAVYTSSWAEAGVAPERIMEVKDIADLIFTTSCLSPRACVEDVVVRPIEGDLP